MHDHRRLASRALHALALLVLRIRPTVPVLSKGNAAKNRCQTAEHKRKPHVAMMNKRSIAANSTDDLPHGSGTRSKPPATESCTGGDRHHVPTPCGRLLPRVDDRRTRVVRFECCAPVAQLDRASGYEPEGREFEPLRARHFPLCTSIALAASVRLRSIRLLGFNFAAVSKCGAGQAQAEGGSQSSQIGPLVLPSDKRCPC
jgi:hypothetical protein